MKISKHFVVIFWLCILVLLINCGSQKDNKDDLKAGISIVNGTEVIKNPSEPLYGELKLELTEELTIGHKEDDFLSFIAEVDVDKNGNIYVLDYKEDRLKIFDSEGNFIRAIGQTGQGPKDLYEPLSLDVDASGRIYITDNSLRTRIFDFNGELLDFIRLKKSYPEYSLTADGNFVCIGTTFGPQRLKSIKKLLKITPGGDIIKEYISKEIKNRIRYPGGNGTIIFPSEFLHDIIYYVSKKSMLYYGDSSSYKIYVRDKNDRLIKEIRRDEKSAKISGEEKNKQVEHYHKIESVDSATISKLKMLIPDYKPFFFAFLVDERERLFVFKRYTYEDNEPVTVDIFDENGQYIYRTVMQWVPKLIHSGYLYVADLEGDDFVLKKMKIKNLLK